MGGGAGGGGRGLLYLVIDTGRGFFTLRMASESEGRSPEGTGGGRDAGDAGVAMAESSGVNIATLRGYMSESYIHNNARRQTGR